MKLISGVRPRHITNWICVFSFLFGHSLGAYLLAGKLTSNQTKRTAENHLILDPNKLLLTCEKFFSPFSEPDRKSLALLKGRLVGIYGEYRRSYRPGHRHSGIDLKGAFDETVYAIGLGRVIHIFRQFPHQTVVVKHYLPDEGFLYSVYTHIEDITVKHGVWVDDKTPLARLFNEDELRRADFGTPNHLHLEIRKSFSDKGRASYASMTMSQLNQFCRDPVKFFKECLH